VLNALIVGHRGAVKSETIILLSNKAFSPFKLLLAQRKRPRAPTAAMQAKRDVQMHFWRFGIPLQS
jgi:hypothetical protein